MIRNLARFAVLALVAACGSSHENVDASAPTHDAPPPTGAFGSDCSSHTDCLSGYCLQAVGAVGGVCTRTCNDDCPPDWSCHQLHGGENPAKICVPNAPQLCLACATDTECGADGACLAFDGSKACGTKCTGSCPTGYTCAADATGTHAGTYCQPVTGSCTCTAAMNGASRTCTSINAIGTCFGTETCTPATGWSTCTAASATAETCNGNDDDCDFLIDEDTGGGQACTNTVPGIGSCPGTRSCAGAAGFVCEGQMPTAEACNFADDDCDGRTDETFPGVGTLCSPGVGACQRFGSMSCNSGGTAVVCSVTAGTPTAERCDGSDDDCDGKTDETFTTLGTPCSAGFGVCTRYGTTVCSMDGLSATCSATAAMSMTTETCNYLDDDCNGVIDNGFKNAVSGAYDTTANCGSCGNNCATVFTGANSSGACSTSTGAPRCVMVCGAGAFDLDSSAVNGCEFVLDATSVYVSSSESLAVDDATCGLGPTGSGTGNHPCATIAFGLMRAATLSRANVRVADGTYDEAVTLVSGRNLNGGYRPGTWERHLATTSTIIQGVASTGNHDSTVTATNVTNATLSGFVVRGAFNTKPSGNSYAIYVSGGSSTLNISDNKIFAGRGGPGTSGSGGTAGASGVNGTGSVNGSYDSFVASGSGACATTNNRQYANGGVKSCGASAVSGGAGGGNRCAPASDDSQFSAINGFAGSTGGGGAGGAGGMGGFDGVFQKSGGGTACIIPGTGPMAGADGPSGQPGANGAIVAGCTNTAGSVVAGHWANGSAVGGNPGTNGGGGGGGGAGAGSHCINCGTGNKDRLGAHGGGGGSGGCGGTGGSAGGSGGGVFGIFIVGGSAPTLTNNTIQRGDGGAGGDGGIGGAGGLGGGGGDGGGASGAAYCAGKAGRGGNGGAAGQGSGGGGGCGGSSFAIFTSGIGTPPYCGSNSVSGGSGGPGGPGGYSGGGSSGDGTTGGVQGCTSI